MSYSVCTCVTYETVIDLYPPPPPPPKKKEKKKKIHEIDARKMYSAKNLKIKF